MRILRYGVTCGALRCNRIMAVTGTGEEMKIIGSKVGQNIVKAAEVVSVTVALTLLVRRLMFHTPTLE